MRSFLLTSQYKKSVSSHRVDQYIDLINHYFGSQSEETYRVSLSSAERADCALSDRSNKDNRIVLNVNSEASSRRMPLDKSVKLIDALVNKFGYTIQLTGSSRDTVFTEQICKQVKTPEKIENLSGKTALLSLINICNRARIIISTDSGIAHLANALNKPVIVLFGAGDDLNTSPYNKEMLHILRAPGIPCAPCVKNTCKYGHVNCMHRIDEKNIIDFVAKYQ
jgi:ADP-heptose:LPS heptosyltransferase